MYTVIWMFGTHEFVYNKYHSNWRKGRVDLDNDKVEDEETQPNKGDDTLAVCQGQIDVGAEPHLVVHPRDDHHVAHEAEQDHSNVGADDQNRLLLGCYCHALVQVRSGIVKIGFSLILSRITRNTSPNLLLRAQNSIQFFCA